MRLKEFQVRKFRNVLDSTPIPVEGQVTCLVGKNESGKTALLQALYRLKPAYGEKLDLDEQYPRWLKVRDAKSGEATDVRPIRAVFTIEDADRKIVNDRFGEGALTSDSYTREVKYDGSSTVTFSVSEAAFVRKIVTEATLSDSVREVLSKCESVELLKQEISDQRTALDEDEESVEESRESLDAIEETLKLILGDSSLWNHVATVLREQLPTFFYFNDYSILPGRLDLREITPSDSEKPAGSSHQTARALLKLARTDVESLSDENYEARKAELEAVSNELSSQVFDYWSQNQELSVDIDVDKVTENQPNGHTAVARFLEIRVRDQRHGYTNNFGQRSSGFQWFFSFLAAFSEFEDLKTGVIVLLDEPALTLHGKAQADFLRFINERLASGAQVIYTTHSPFMVEMGHLERVRVVEDKGPTIGAQATTEVFGTDRDSLFPLQAAIGYDIAQTLFVGPDNLVVEGSSDFTYLTVISDYLATLKRATLDPRWRILLAGGSSNIPAFVTLIGPHLDITVLVDAGTEGMQRLTSMQSRGLLEGKRLITIAEITGSRNADIEDLFSVADYLKIYNEAMGMPLIAESELPAGDRIVKRIAQKIGKDFKHGLPADFLLRHRDTVCPALGEDTLDRFERLIVRINETLS